MFPIVARAHLIARRLVANVLAHWNIHNALVLFNVASNDGQIELLNESPLEQLTDLSTSFLVQRNAQQPAGGIVQAMYEVEVMAQSGICQVWQLSFQDLLDTFLGM